MVGARVRRDHPPEPDNEMRGTCPTTSRSGPAFRNQQTGFPFGQVDDVAYIVVRQVDPIDQGREFLCDPHPHPASGFSKTDTSASPDRRNHSIPKGIGFAVFRPNARRSVSNIARFRFTGRRFA
jgi:hypothetical protein